MYWHSFECSSSRCERGPSGVIIDIRTEQTKRPSKVKCPYCGKSARYRGFWEASEAGFALHREVRHEDFVAEIRMKTPAEIRKILKDAKIIEGWTRQNFGAMQSVYAFENSFKALGSILRQGTQWLAKVSVENPKDLGLFGTCEDAKTVVLYELHTNYGYIIPAVTGCVEPEPEL